MRIGLALWGTEPVQSVVRYARMAEEAGFESIWLVDTHLICRELYVTLAACATATTQLKLASGVTVPLTRHPSVTASGLASLHELSDGRALGGISTGHSALRNIGHKPVRITELADYIATVRTLLRGESARFDSGTDGAISWLAEPAEVPLHVAATGPVLTRAAAGMADGVIMLRGAAPHLIDEGVAIVDQGLEDSQRSRDEIEVTAWVYVGIDEDPLRAHDQVRARVAAVLRMGDVARFEGEDRDVVNRLRAAYDMFAHADSMPEHASLVPERMLDRYAVAGTPDLVRERIASLAADPRIDRIVVSPQIGAPGTSITSDFITAFADAVF